MTVNAAVDDHLKESQLRRSKSRVYCYYLLTVIVNLSVKN